MSGVKGVAVKPSQCLNLGKIFNLKKNNFIHFRLKQEQKKTFGNSIYIFRC